ncbi:hypothetical protein OROHE_001874 [Orobanche hederae]
MDHHRVRKKMEGLIPMVYKAFIKKNRKRGGKAYECLSSGAARTDGFYTGDGDDDDDLFSRKQHHGAVMPRAPDSSPWPCAANSRFNSVDVSLVM